LPVITDGNALIRFDSGTGGPYHARAMGNPLRDRRTPSELAASAQVIEIAEKISIFAELERILRADLETLDPGKLPPGWRDALVEGRLSFGFADAQRRLPSLEGRVAVTIDAVCQRCLQPLRLPVVAELRLVFPDAAGPGVDAAGHEVWELDEPRLRPLDLVEEALIMAMPLAALHEDDASCRRPAIAETASGDTIRPFAALRSQLDEQD
jgi:Large ribosomal RNA subunit accumulation protein YceD